MVYCMTDNIDSLYPGTTWTNDYVTYLCDDLGTHQLSTTVVQLMILLQLH